MLISPALLDFLEQAIEPIPAVIPLAGTGISKASKAGGWFQLWQVADTLTMAFKQPLMFYI